ncbi:ABC transporter substrate-binding protein [Psychromonas marina]|uniref:ABC transporter substrate-binding protein n=1 Tax=Psychromonas marina TaxID=88364 RepID=A0ABQ6E0Y6_9GAMM|nr:ABC transporter substrate-binding protein [Psychromonas marina]GLS91000.1 ABC transporter substrate-binding protein [Psychromonas marina]
MNVHIAISHLVTYIAVLSFFIVAGVQAQGNLDVAITLEPPVLDPAINASASVQKTTYQNIFEGLTQIDNLNQVQPSLADSWQVDESGLLYTFTLRKNVFFHDRRQLTAAVVKSSLERIIATNSINPIKDKFANIKDISVISTYVIEVKLSWSNGDFLYNLGLGNAVIQHPKSWRTNATKPIGTGPYRFVNWKRGSHITLVANHHYWGKVGSIKNIKIVFTPSRTQIVSYLADGLLDGYSSMTEVGFLNSLFVIRQDYTLKMGNTSGEIIIAMNHANEMLSSLAIRQAITLSINKKQIADTPNFITGAEIGSHYSPDDIAYLDLTNAYPFDLKKARQLIDDADIAIKPLRLIAPPTSYAQYISLHLQQMLLEIGFTLEVEEVSWQEWLTRVYKDKDYDLTIIAHTEPDDLDIYARDDYYFNYNSHDYKQIIEQLNHTHDKALRIELLKQAQKKLSDDAVNVFLFMLPKVGIWHKQLRGYWINEPIPTMIFSQMHWQE